MSSSIAFKYLNQISFPIFILNGLKIETNTQVYIGGRFKIKLNFVLDQTYDHWVCGVLDMGPDLDPYSFFKSYLEFNSIIYMENLDSLLDLYQKKMFLTWPNLKFFFLVCS